MVKWKSDSVGLNVELLFISHCKLISPLYGAPQLLSVYSWFVYHWKLPARSTYCITSQLTLLTTEDLLQTDYFHSVFWMVRNRSPNVATTTTASCVKTNKRKPLPRGSKKLPDPLLTFPPLHRTTKILQLGSHNPRRAKRVHILANQPA